MDSSSSSEYDADELIEYNPCTTDSEADERGAASREPSLPPAALEQQEMDGIQCRLCLAEVPTMPDLICHFLLHHESDGNGTIQRVSGRLARAMQGHVPQKFICGLCGVQCFDTLRETRRHMFEEHGHEDPDVRDSGADYSSEESNQYGTDTDVMVAASDNDSTDGVSSGMISEMSSSTQYVSSPDSRRTRRRSCSFSSSEYELEHKDRPGASSPELGPNRPMDEFEDYLRSVTMKSLMEKFKSEVHYKCSRKGCQYKFITGDVREQHLACHTDDSVPGTSDTGSATSTGKRRSFGFKCTHCDQRFDSWKPCLVHLWTVHQTDLGMLRCTLCEKRFGYVVHVFNHLQTHRPKFMREIQCRVCDQRFANTAQRSVHEALHRRKGHPMKLEPVREEDISPETEARGPQPMQRSVRPQVKRKTVAKPRLHTGRRCKLCNGMFSNAKILSKHVKTVHFKIKPFICNVCEYKCARKVTLTIHMRQHSGAKPLACQSCSYRTADPSALHYHERRHREDKLYKCRICGLTTVQTSALKRHIQTNHPQEYERIKCRLCSFASINAQILRRHQADHEAGLIVGSGENERPGAEALVGSDPIGRVHDVKPVPEVSLDCFLPPESVDSVVHDAGGITIPAVDATVSAAHSDDTQFHL